MANLKLPDLDCRSVFNVVEENFNKVGLKTYANRLIYIGEHTRPKDDMIYHFKKSIRDVNSSYCEIYVTGILLMYDSYFVHIVEGSEDTIHRHLRFMFQREVDWIEEMRLKDIEDEKIAEAARQAALEEGITLQPVQEDTSPKTERKFFRRLKALVIYHSISKISFTKWSAVIGHPPSIVGRIEMHGPLAMHLEQLRICLDKIKLLCKLAQSEEHLSFEGLRVTDPKMEALPAVALLDFLLQSQYIMDLRVIYSVHRRIDDFIYYAEKVWPLPTHFTPRLLFKLKIDDTFVDPLPVMSWEMKKEEDEEKEEQDRGSDSSDE